MLKASEDVNVN